MALIAFIFGLPALLAIFLVPILFVFYGLSFLEQFVDKIKRPLDNHPFWSTKWRGINWVNIGLFAFFIWFYQYLDIEPAISLFFTSLSIVSIGVLLYKFCPKLFEIKK